MRQLYKGTINNLYIKDLKIENGNIKNIILASTTLNKEACFYKGPFGTIISFEYETKLPNYGEAEDYIKHQITLNSNKKDLATCLYLDEDSIRPEKCVKRKVFKQLKKELRKKRY